MIENRRGLTIFSHAMLIMGIMVILFPLYVAFVAATLDNKAVFETPMTLVPGTQLLENMKYIWVNGVGVNSAPFWLMMLNSFIMAFSITVGKITVSMLSAFAIVWFRFPLRNLFFWMIFITLMLPVEVRIFPTVEVIANLKMLDSYAGLTLPLMASATATFLFRQFFMTLPDELVEAARIDGAGKFKQIFRVTLPQLNPMITLMILMSCGRIFSSDFGLFYQVPQNSGALYSVTQTIDTYVYRGLMQLGDVGMSSAAGLFQSVVGFLFVFGANAIVRATNKENALF